MKKIAYIIKDITDFGKLMSLCIEKDISVWRTYWNENEKETVYSIDWKDKKCYYSSRRYYESKGYQIQTPMFYVDKYGKYHITDDFDTWLENQPEGTFVQGGGLDGDFSENNDKKD